MLDIWYRVKTAKAHQKNREMKGVEREYVFGFLLNRRATEKTRQITTDEISVYELQKFFSGRLSFKKFLRRKLLNFFCILL